MVCEQVDVDYVWQLVEFVFQFFWIGDLQVVDVQDLVVVVGDYVFVLGWLVVGYVVDLVGDQVVCYWDYFYWQWEFVQYWYLFVWVDDVDEVFVGFGDDFFVGQCGVVVFDQVFVWVVFVGVIDVQ